MSTTMTETLQELIKAKAMLSSEIMLSQRNRGTESPTSAFKAEISNHTLGFREALERAQSIPLYGGIQRTPFPSPDGREGFRDSNPFNAGFVQRRDTLIPAKPETSSLATAEYQEADLTDARVGLALEVEDVLGYTPLRKAVNAPSRLRRCLESLDIAVFENTSVDVYKAKMQAHFQAIADSNSRKDFMVSLRIQWMRRNLHSYLKPVPEHVLRKCVQIKKEIPEAVFYVDELVEERKTLDPFMLVELNGEQLYFEVWDEPEFEKAL